MPEARFQLRDLTVFYGAARVLERVDLDVGAGEVIGFVGPNGAGKTTTLRAVSGLIGRRSGTVRLDGEDIPPSPRIVAARGIAHVPEGRGLIAKMTVAQNLRLAVVAIGGRYGDGHAERAVATFPALARLMDRRAGLLSGGEQQMVAIARGIAVAPKILMIDELSLGLAPKIVHDLLNALLRVARENVIGVLLVDQNVRALSRVCDRVYVLREGRSALADHGDEGLMRAVYFGQTTSRKSIPG